MYTLLSETCRKVCLWCICYRSTTGRMCVFLKNSLSACSCFWAVVSSFREWFHKFNIPLKDDYFFTWTRTQATLCKHLQFLEEHISEKTMISIWNATLITLYLNYDITEDFQTQFQQNSDAILSLIETLGTVDIPKKS